MDFTEDAADASAKPLESPTMELEEAPATEGELPVQKDSPVVQQQPSPRATPMLPNMESSPCSSDSQAQAEDPRWLLNPQDHSVPGYADVDVEVSRYPMEEGASPEDQQCRESPPRGPGHAAEARSAPQGPAAADQEELLMELEEAEAGEEYPGAERLQLQDLLAQLQRLSPSDRDSSPTSEDGLLPASDSEESQASGADRAPLLAPVRGRGQLLHLATGHGLGAASHQLLQPAHWRKGRRLLSAEADCEDLLSLLQCEGGPPADGGDPIPLACSDMVAGGHCQGGRAAERALAPERPIAPSLPGSAPAEHEADCRWAQQDGGDGEEAAPSGARSSPEPGWAAAAPGSSCEEEPASGSDLLVSIPRERLRAEKGADLSSFPDYKEVPGPCEPEDLLDGVIFGAKYLGSTQLVSERNPPTSVRMAQAQEAMGRIKAPEGESQPMTEVDLFVSTRRIKVLTADSQEAMMDHALQTISYIADIGNIVVLMARRKLPRRADTSAEKQLYKMICHVFHSSDAQLIAQAIGQAFSVAYQRFLCASGIDPTQLNPRQSDTDALEDGEELYNGDLAHFSKQENCMEVTIAKQKGEILGVVIVESGWGSILPTVVIANLMHRGAAERSGKLSIGDRIMSVNGTSLVGLPLASCQSIIRDLKNQTEVTLNVVHCPPVTTAIVRRPDTKYPLGFCVENGIICSLMRGGIAERGGIRVGHRIIEINGQSVVAMSHEKIIQILTQAVSEVHIKTMPASTYRLLTGQEQPIFL
ncbi:amyloid-beta A4 precursor protein-binding family A member 3 isoform X2 [Varanus komodoensis]|uniref:amyloid-beta A4 precursor protein-binding family A member 3 isoform X2 n=1 Tax=Varanus komodoensis TaxID=61221 RepID=UPI001CF76D1A|nr:amyloid-beta A4 precursor protein-binding family A member 3 isoform X2 [Varanus komodoensis]